MVLNEYRLSKIKLDIRGIRISAEEILFYTGLILWTAQVYIGKTIYADFYSGKLLTAVRLRGGVCGRAKAHQYRHAPDPDPVNGVRGQIHPV